MELTLQNFFMRLTPVLDRIYLNYSSEFVFELYGNQLFKDLEQELKELFLTLENNTFDYVIREWLTKFTGLEGKVDSWYQRYSPKPGFDTFGPIDYINYIEEGVSEIMMTEEEIEAGYKMADESYEQYLSDVKLIKSDMEKQYLSIIRSLVKASNLTMIETPGSEVGEVIKGDVFWSDISTNLISSRFLWSWMFESNLVRESSMPESFASAFDREGPSGRLNIEWLFTSKNKKPNIKHLLYLFHTLRIEGVLSVKSNNALCKRLSLIFVSDGGYPLDVKPSYYSTMIVSVEKGQVDSHFVHKVRELCEILKRNNLPIMADFQDLMSTSKNK